MFYAATLSGFVSVGVNEVSTPTVQDISLLEHSADFLFPRSSHRRARTGRSSAGLQ